MVAAGQTREGVPSLDPVTRATAVQEQDEEVELGPKRLPPVPVHEVLVATSAAVVATGLKDSEAPSFQGAARLTTVTAMADPA